MSDLSSYLSIQGYSSICVSKIFKNRYIDEFRHIDGIPDIDIWESAGLDSIIDDLRSVYKQVTNGTLDESDIGALLVIPHYKFLPLSNICKQLKHEHINWSDPNFIKEVRKCLFEYQKETKMSNHGILTIYMDVAKELDRVRSMEQPTFTLYKSIGLFLDNFIEKPHVCIALNKISVPKFIIKSTENMLPLEVVIDQINVVLYPNETLTSISQVVSEKNQVNRASSSYKYTFLKFQAKCTARFMESDVTVSLASVKSLKEGLDRYVGSVITIISKRKSQGFFNFLRSKPEKASLGVVPNFIDQFNNGYLKNRDIDTILPKEEFDKLFPNSDACDRHSLAYAWYSFLIQIPSLGSKPAIEIAKKFQSFDDIQHGIDVYKKNSQECINQVLERKAQYDKEINAYDGTGKRPKKLRKTEMNPIPEDPLYECVKNRPLCSKIRNLFSEECNENDYWM